MGISPSSTRRAFTLIEAMVVVVLMSVIAVTVLPALGNLEDARRGAAADELARMLTHARSLAMASGEPSGVEIDLGNESARLVRIASAGGSPVAAIDALGQPEQGVVFSDLYAGVELVSLIQGDGSGGSGTIWFRFDGLPQVRSSSGVLVGAFTQDAEVELSGSRTVTVRMGTGLVE